MKIDFKQVYVQEKIYENAHWKTNADGILARFPDARVTRVDNHWRLPELTRRDPADWMQSKRDYLVLGVRGSFKQAVNGRSADYIAASISNGCLSSCQYCYVARRKGGSNPLTLFVNDDQIIAAIRRHQARLGTRTEPNQTDSHLWTYDIGCNSDLSLDAMIADLPGKLIEAFADMPHAKATFATKTVNHDYWLTLDHKGHTRIRYSLMPQPVARYVDIGTSKIGDRIASINALVDGGYEVHVNFSPIILYGGDQWRRDWVALWEEMNDVLSERAKAQLKCELFFLTHSRGLHEVNMQWNPKGEAFLWSEELRPKPSKPDVLAYDWRIRRSELERFQNGLRKYLPYCDVRYAF